MRTLITYPLPTGGRALVLVYVRDADHALILLDVPADGPLDADADCRIVDDELSSEGQAWQVAVDHMLRSEDLGHPAPVAA